MGSKIFLTDNEAGPEAVETLPAAIELRSYARFGGRFQIRKSVHGGLKTIAFARCPPLEIQQAGLRRSVRQVGC